MDPAERPRNLNIAPPTGPLAPRQRPAPTGGTRRGYARGMEATLIALGAALVYGLISWRVGDLFPFSRYAMYADLRGRSEGAVLVVRLDGKEVDFHEVVAWHGVDPAAIEPFSVPCSLHWVVFEAQRWIGDHTAAAPLELPLEVGYRILRCATSGEVTERFELRGTGTGRLR